MTDQRMAQPALEPVWRLMADRWSTSGDRPVNTIDLRSLEDKTRTALADLLGLDQVPARTGRLAVAKLKDELDLDEHSLRQAVAEIIGPVTDVARIRAARVRARDELWTWLARACEERGLVGWYHQVQAAGVPKGDVEVHRRNLATVLDIVDALPANGVPLARLAAEHLGDPHGLDQGMRLSTLALGAIADSTGESTAESTEDARRLWSLVGVVSDELSSFAVVLGLRTPSSNALTSYLDRAAMEFEPVVLTLGQLRRHPFDGVPHPGTVRVVENPSIVAEAARRERRGVFVCSSGWPSVAVTTLLDGLVAGGCELLVHADFDVNGIKIVRHLQDRCGAKPWAMSAEAYMDHAGQSTKVLDDRQPVPATPWDLRLQQEMTRHGVAVYEEQLVEALLGP